MALSLGFSEDGDMYRIFSIFSDAFGDNEPYVDALFPNHKTPAGREQGAERFLQMKHKDPHARFLNVTDTATGDIIGQAKWLVYEKVPETPELRGDYWETEEQKQYAAHLHAGLLAPRMNAIKAANGRILCTRIRHHNTGIPLLGFANRSSEGLDILTVDPKHQRRGVGTKLVKWGTDLADQMGVEASISRSVHFFVRDEKVLTIYIIRPSSSPQSMDVICMSSMASVSLRTATLRFLRNGRIGRSFGTLLCIDLLRRHRYRSII